jgi:hypothetical protein
MDRPRIFLPIAGYGVVDWRRPATAIISSQWQATSQWQPAS